MVENPGFFLLLTQLNYVASECVGKHHQPLAYMDYVFVALVRGMFRMLLSSPVNSVLLMKTPPSDIHPLHAISTLKK